MKKNISLIQLTKNDEIPENQMLKVTGGDCYGKLCTCGTGAIAAVKGVGGGDPLLLEN